MKKKIIYLVLATLLNQGLLLAQSDTLITKFNKHKNSFRLGIGIANQGTGDQVSLLYQNGYLRKLNKYFELGLGLSFFNYHAKAYPNFMDPSIVKDDFTQIATFDVLLNFLIIDFNRQVLKLGAGYSLEKINMIAWTGAQYFYDENYNYIGAEYIVEKVYDYQNSLLINVEYGFRFSPHFTTSVSGRYYSEGEYITLASLGLNFYYTF